MGVHNPPSPWFLLFLLLEFFLKLFIVHIIGDEEHEHIEPVVPKKKTKKVIKKGKGKKKKLNKERRDNGSGDASRSVIYSRFLMIYIVVAGNYATHFAQKCPINHFTFLMISR